MVAPDVKPVPVTVMVTVPVGIGFGDTWVITGPAYCAVTAVFAAGMISVVDEAAGLATLAPDQPANVSPDGAAFAVMATVAPEAYLPLPFPLPTLSV